MTRDLLVLDGVTVHAAISMRCATSTGASSARELGGDWARWVNRQTICRGDCGASRDFGPRSTTASTTARQTRANASRPSRFYWAAPISLAQSDGCYARRGGILARSTRRFHRLGSVVAMKEFAAARR